MLPGNLMVENPRNTAFEPATARSRRGRILAGNPRKPRPKVTTGTGNWQPAQDQAARACGQSIIFLTGTGNRATGTGNPGSITSYSLAGS